MTVEVSSVNRKQSEITVNLPRELEVLEAQIRDDVNKAVSRGRLTVRVSMHSAETSAARETRRTRMPATLEDDLPDTTRRLP